MWEFLPDWQNLLSGAIAAIGAYMVATRQGKATVEAAKVEADAAKAEAEAAKVQAQAEAQAQVSSTRGPEWETFLGKVEAHFEKRLSDQDKKIDDLNDRVSKLTETIADVKNLYSLSLAYVRQLWVAEPGLEESVPPPVEIVEDLLAA